MVTVPTVTKRTVDEVPTALPAPATVRQTAEGATGAAFGSQLAESEANVGAALTRIGQQSSQAAIQLQERQNAREIMKQFNAYSSGIATLYRQTIDGLDITDPVVVQNFNAQLQQMRDDAIAANQGGPIAASELDKLLSEAQSGISMKMVGDVQEAYEADAARIDTEESNRLYQTAFKNPLLLKFAQERAETLAGIANRGSTPQKSTARRKMYLSRTLEGALDGMLSQGNYLRVADILRDNPDAANILGEEALDRVLWKMNALESGVDKDNITVNVNEETTEALFTTLGEGAGQRGVDTIEKAGIARDLLASMSVQRALLQSGKLKPGFASTGREVIASALALFNMDDPELLNALELGDPAASAVFNAESSRQVLTWAEQGSRLTNLLIKTAYGAVPQLMFTKAGNQLILDVREFQLNATLEEADIYERAVIHQDKAKLFEELRQHRQKTAEDFEFLEKAISDELAVPGRPKSWKEVVDQARATAAALAGRPGAAAAGTPAAARPALSPEQTTSVTEMVSKQFPGWSFVQVGPDGKVIVENAEGIRKRTKLTAEDMLGEAGTIQETPAPAQPAQTGSEAPNAESSNPDPFSQPPGPAKKPRSPRKP